MAAADPEFTVICMDNSESVRSYHFHDAQREAIKLYCRTKFKCNPENTVCLLTMAAQFGTLVFPTNSLQKILSCLEKDTCYHGLEKILTWPPQQDILYRGKTKFSSAIHRACTFLSKSPPHMKRRLLMFVGGPINLRVANVKEHGPNLKRLGVALDVVNFFSLEVDYRPRTRSSILTGTYCYAKKELEELVAAVNVNNNSHMVDVADVSSVVKILSDSPILKKNLDYIEEKKAAADAENVEASRIKNVKPESKNKSVAADGECVQAPGTKYGERYSAKNTEQSHNEKNQKKPIQWIDNNRFQLLQNLENIDHM